MRAVSLLCLGLLLAGCSGRSPTAPSSTGGSGMSGTPAAAVPSVAVWLTTVGPLPATPVVVQVSGAPATIVEPNGGFVLRGLPSALVFRFDGREAPVAMPVTDPSSSLAIDIRLDTTAGTARVTRVCSSTTTSAGSLAPQLTMCVTSP